MVGALRRDRRMSGWRWAPLRRRPRLAVRPRANVHVARRDAEIAADDLPCERVKLNEARAVAALHKPCGVPAFVAESSSMKRAVQTWIAPFAKFECSLDHATIIVAYALRAATRAEGCRSRTISSATAAPARATKK